MKKHLWCCKFFLKLSRKILIAITILSIFSAMSFSILLTLLTDYRENFDRTCEATNAQNNIFVYSDPDLDGLKNDVHSILEKDQKVDAYEFLDSTFFWGGCKFGKGIMLCWMLPVDLEKIAAQTIGQHEIISQDQSIDGIYLPYLFFASGNYHIGDDFSLTDNSKELTLRVAGFYSSPMTDTENCYMITLPCNRETYKKIENTFDDKAVIVSVKSNDPSYSAELESGLPKKVTATRSDSWLVTQNRSETVKNVKYITVIVLSAIIGILSLAFLLMMFVSLNILLNNFIHDNTSIFGILKAMGYKTRVLNSMITTIFLSESVLSAICGIALSYVFFPTLSMVLEAQSGVVYHTHFLPLQSAIVLLVIVLDTLFAVMLSRKSLEKMLPIQAIREMKPTLQVKKEKYTVAGSKFPLNLSLSVKNIFQRPRQSIIIVLTMVAVSFMTVFSLILGNSVLSIKETTVGMIFGELADAAATVPAPLETQLADDLESDPRVSRYFSYDISKALINDAEEQLFIAVAGDPEKLKNTDNFYEGTYPKKENEITLGGKFAEKYNIKIGDTVTLKLGQNEADFQVCGFTQTFVYLGNECMVLRSAYEKLKPLPIVQYYISLDPEADAEAFISELRQKPFVNGASNLAAYRTGVIDPYLKIMSAVTRTLMVFCLVVVFIIIYYLTSYVLTTKQKNMAVMRALGFTTSQCILQTTYEIILPVLISTMISITLSRLAITPLLKFFLHTIGLMKPFLYAPFWQLFGSGLLIVLLILAFVVVLSLRIRNYTFRELVGKR